MFNPKVSVTVPLYNSAKYLRKCLDSLVFQTLKEIEIILVDDGSTDCSGEICEEYARIYSNIKVIHQKNSGSAIARQVGLDASSGEYTIVCDSDDWVEADMYEKLYNEAKKSDADMVMCGYFCEYPNGNSVPVQKWFSHLDFDGHVKELMNSSYNASWIRLIRRKLLVDNNIRYEANINLGEDALILYKILKTKPKITQIENKLYHYRKNANTSSYTSKVTMQNVKAGIKIREWVKDNYNNKQFEEGLYRMTLNNIFAAFRAIDTDYLYVKQMLKTELSWKFFFKYNKNLKVYIVFSAKILPVKMVCQVSKKLYNKRNRDLIN